MKKNIILALSLILGMALTSCDDFLTRTDPNKPTDESFFKTESDMRLYANGFYPNYFIGYGVSWSAYYSPYRGYTFSDDVASTGTQSSFEDVVPSSRGSSSESAVGTYLSQYAGPSWCFSWVRKANIFIDRIESNKANFDDEAYNHWMAVAKFFKCYSYCRLVEVFGDVPYYEKTLTTADLDELYKDRDSRTVVMDKVYDMLKNEVLVNMRANDGSNMLNRYVAAAFASRWFLFEGTWQKYHSGDQALAKKYLEFARDAAEMVMSSGNYAIATPVRDLWGSQDLAGNTECLMYRHFDFDLGVRHCVASYSNGVESQTGVNLNFLKSVICRDGKPYTTSTLADAGKLSLADMAKTRDPRFEAQFIDHPNRNSSTLVYQDKFIDRYALTLGETVGTNALYGSNTNTNDAPVIRYGEVLLSWIEAKAELALLGGAAVTQADIDRSINVLRDRPLDATAQEKGLTTTAHMVLADINASFDPARDQDVDPLVWEIRRERRLEMVFEHARIIDLRRWKKLDYMDNEKHPDTMLGPWIDFQEELPTFLKTGSGATRVQKADGTVVTYNGSNAADMVGYYIPTSIAARDPFTDRSYVAPIGQSQINDYQNRGYTLTQTQGW